ncbi:hypothetical protein ACKWRH_36990 [Bradyrhizobium sp. Pa8]|uniref:hypothetical protein n=1 Tax=Bradyrhizobium sp. Pa8 TaxID=3386552 RepID=UPI00403F41A7
MRTIRGAQRHPRQSPRGSALSGVGQRGGGEKYRVLVLAFRHRLAEVLDRIAQRDELGTAGSTI